MEIDVESLVEGMVETLRGVGITVRVDHGEGFTKLTVLHDGLSIRTRRQRQTGRRKDRVLDSPFLSNLTAAEAVDWFDSHQPEDWESYLEASRATCYRRLRALREVAVANPDSRDWADEIEGS